MLTTITVTIEHKLDPYTRQEWQNLADLIGDTAAEVITHDRDIGLVSTCGEYHIAKRIPKTTVKEPDPRIDMSDPAQAEAQRKYWEAQ